MSWSWRGAPSLLPGVLPDPTGDTLTLRRGLLLRLLALGWVSIGAFAVGYWLIGLRTLVWVEVAFFVEVGCAYAWLRWGKANTGNVALLQAICVFLVIAANTLLLGGFLPSAGFAVWAYMPPLAAMFLLEGRARLGLNIVTAIFLVGVLAAEPFLQPVEQIPPDLLRVFFFLNVSCTVVSILGSLGYFHQLLLDERRVMADSERRHRLTLEQMPLAIALKDHAGRYAFVNKAFEHTFGIDRAAVLDQGDALWEPADAARLRRTEAAVLADDATVEGDEPFTIRGERRVLRSTRLRLTDPQGRPLLCWVSDDVTDRQRAERAVQNERHLEALGTLAGGIAHDFNNLLMAVQGNLELAALDPLPPRTVKRLEGAERAVGRARELTRQILTFARGGAPSRARIPLRGLLEEAATFALMGTSTRLSLAVAPGLPSVEADTSQLGRVIHNLVLNAAQAMPGGGVVELRAAVVDDDALPEGLVAEQGYLRIEVADHGEGIPAELQHRVFDPFFTTRPKGSGLGLTTCHSIIRQHEGALTLRSNPGQGTVVSIFLPIAGGVTEEVPLPVLARAPSPGVRLLVMDDDDTVRDTLVELLSALGHAVTPTADGAAAVARYAEAQAAGQPFDAVFLDLTVPGGMGGVDAARLLLAANPKARLIAASGYAEDSVRAGLFALGFKAALEKPFTLAEAQRALTEALRD